LFIAALAALIAFSTVVLIPSLNAPSDAAVKTFEYVLVFQNGQTVSGSVVGEPGNTSFVPDVGGTDPNNPETGMWIHMSCSDNFNLHLDPADPSYGYSAAGAEPTDSEDSGWRIADYAFRRVGTNGGQCGNSDLFEFGRIVVEKQTDPDGDQTAFTFTGDAAGDISDGQQITVSELAPGTYTSTETVPTGWDLTSIVCDEGANGDLDTKTATYTIVAGETLTCVFTNTKQPPPPVPGIDIEKSTNGEDADTPTGPSVTVGDQVTWEYVVTNTGEVDLTGVVVTDDILGDICTIGNLAIGATAKCEKTGTATLGQYANVGTVTGDYNQGETTVKDTDPSHYLGVAAPVPGINIEKSTNGFDADAPTGPSITVGDQVTWEYVVTNTGQVDLTGVIVTDDILGHICTIGNLAIGASAKCEKTGVAVAGQYANVGTATDNNGDGSTVTDNDPSHYFGQEVAASATIGDTVWSDENDNGVQDNGEKGIAGATVRLTLPDGTTIQMNTNANGNYLFSGLEAGTYKSELILSSIPDPSEGTLKLTTAGSFTIQLADGESFLDADFGVVAALPKTGISADSLALIALALLLAGGLAVLATRKREVDHGEGDIVA
jgi:LPXTG-motif cell wall-anchored protein